MIAGNLDGPISEGQSKVRDFKTTIANADLSWYHMETISNGFGPSGPDFHSSGSANTGDFIYFTSNGNDVATFFGFSLTITWSKLL